MEDKHPAFTYYTPPAVGAKFAPMDEERLFKRAVPRIEEGLEIKEEEKEKEKEEDDKD